MDEKLIEIVTFRDKRFLNHCRRNNIVAKCATKDTNKKLVADARGITIHFYKKEGGFKDESKEKY